MPCLRSESSRRRHRPRRRHRASPCWCPATTRNWRSTAWCAISGRCLPQAHIYVYDNNSHDRTREVAAAAGAIVRTERRQGKGNVVRRMFADIDADVYVLVDGDATYEASGAPDMVQRLLADNLDMMVGCRVHTDEAAYRAGHQAGNAMLTGFVAWLFGTQLHRHPVGLPRLLQALREILSGTVEGFRDRDRTDRACARTAHAGGRDRDSPTAPGRPAR